ncbi:glycosyl transferase family 2 [Anaerobacterium chartisolvens]|uniref:Glycosyl transferase family 2 n=1 Tax=Anaerobacterium chartisolvens TaxID=1297424 RepID=A0A369BFL6_9FIRM|nr:glycosyltransferase family 2 protein [Anaerobacterium chartisolvens]RCX19267.1 glycosyl transferase family 2 [Anaerobacterium chartisolvens]
MENPLVSVIIPTYKRDEFLIRAVKSVLNQTYKKIEIVIVDDNIPGSDFQKRSFESIKPYISNEQAFGPVIKYLNTRGCIGGGAARNFGVKNSTGDYLAFLDDDDRYLNNKIEEQLKFMINRKIEMSYQDVKWIDEEDRLVEYRKMDYVKKSGKNELLKQHILHSIAPTAVYMLTRDAFFKTEGFGEVKVGQDFILMLRCIEAGVKIEYMPGAYVLQYLHGKERISLGLNKIEGENELYALKRKYFKLLEGEERVYVKFRHFAVLCFACLRSKMYLKSLEYALITFFTSPIECCNEARRYFGNRRESEGSFK